MIRVLFYNLVSKAESDALWFLQLLDLKVALKHLKIPAQNPPITNHPYTCLSGTLYYQGNKKWWCFWVQHQYLYTGDSFTVEHVIMFMPSSYSNVLCLVMTYYKRVLIVNWLEIIHKHSSWDGHAHTKNPISYNIKWSFVYCLL